MAIIYITIKQAVKIHANTIEASGGGTLGQLNIGQLESVLEHIQNDTYYPTFASKLTRLFFGACKFHCFQEGNKRIAITLCAYMLLSNGYMHCSGRFIIAMENISYHVASGAINEELLGEIIRSFLDADEENEQLKLKILRAISQHK
jgi:death on curing protein